MSRALLILFFVMIGLTVFVMSELKAEAHYEANNHSPILSIHEIIA